MSRRRNRYGFSRWPEYVPVATQKKNAEAALKKLQTKNKEINPVVITGKMITNTFWGKSWCKHLESYSDFDNRLPRGRSYVRNGSVLDLNINKGEINAVVNGSSLYKVKVIISPLKNKKWRDIVNSCVGKIDSMIELLQGKFSKNVMEIITHQKNGLFPHANEIKFDCSCPDYADMCKHVAAVLYGIGARLDDKPEQLFILRHVDHTDLLSATEAVGKLSRSKAKSKEAVFTDSDLSSLFGIEIQDAPVAVKKINSKSTAKVTQGLVNKKLIKNNSRIKKLPKVNTTKNKKM